MSQMREKLFRATTQVLCLLAAASWAARAGDLEPPGPPGPTMKPLSAVEPRIPIHPDMLPLTITQPGSYYLTGHVGTAGGGVTIDADNVTLDLMGFTLAGGTDNGITAAPGRGFIVVRNGTVRGWGQHGIALEDNAIVEHVVVAHNGANGVQLRNWGSVSDSVVYGNGQHGITVAHGAVVARCAARGNGETGIWAVGESLVTDSLANYNLRTGIRVDQLTTVARCSATYNDSLRIYGGVGIWVTGTANRVEDNHVSLNPWGILVDGADNVLSRNLAVANYFSNYQIAPGTTGNLCEIKTDLTGAGPWSNFSK